jgi:putative methyltransferase (TIGR04325 family)
MVLRKILPSPIKSAIRGLVSKPEFIGDYPSWASASEAARGHDVSQVVDKVRSATLKVMDGTAAFERDSVAFHKEEFRWPLLTALLHAATGREGSFHVVDFGGSLGSFYLQHKKFLKDVSGLQWSIVEQSEYVEVGQKEFEDETVQFFLTLKECAKRGPIDVVLFSGSLQYLEDPYHFLEQAAALSVCVMVDRVPFIGRDTDRIAVQRPPSAIYEGSFTHRFFSGEKFERFMSQMGLRLFVEWSGFDHPANIESEYLGKVYVAAGASESSLDDRQSGRDLHAPSPDCGQAEE